MRTCFGVRVFFFSSRRRHTLCSRDWSSDVCSSDLHGDVLLFLHADTLLSQEAYGAMLRALEEPTVVGGCFRLRFDARHPLLWLASFSTRFKLPFVHLGDSAYFLRRDVFDALGGYRDMPVLEDLDLWRRLNRS